MDSVALLILLVALAGVALVAVVVGLVVTGRRKPAPLPETHSDVLTTPPADPEAPTELSAPPATLEPEVEPGVEEPAAPVLERPEGTASRLVRLRQRLAGSQGTLGRGLLALLSRDRLDEDTWESIEDTLLTADIGVAPTQELVERLRTRLRVEGEGDPRTVLREELVALVDPDLDRRLQVSGEDGTPGVVLVVGVNGAGKTTTVGKIARILVAEDRSVVLGAADTFRAAAVEQLATWGERVGVDVVRGEEGADPASVAFRAVQSGTERGVDTVLVDTAGRLQNKQGLMDELGKVKRVIEKQAPVTEVLLVLDATTGQNGLIQARVFSEAVAALLPCFWVYRDVGKEIAQESGAQNPYAANNARGARKPPACLVESRMGRTPSRQCCRAALGAVPPVQIPLEVLWTATPPSCWWRQPGS